MKERHSNRKLYFDEQEYTVKKYVIPFLQEVRPINEHISVLEIGCGEGGNLKPFLDLGCKKVVGVDMSQNKINNAIAFYSDHSKNQNIEFICADIYDIKDLGQFDLIITRDVIEHIHNQEKFMNHCKQFLKSNGKFFFGFPPWQNPFGGHQQMCKSKVLSHLPYFHLLPRPIHKLILKVFGESEIKIKNLLEIRTTSLSVERLERIFKKADYIIDKRMLYFINPGYEIKFGLRPRKQLPILAKIPVFRNFISTVAYYVVSEK